MPVVICTTDDLDCPPCTPDELCVETDERARFGPKVELVVRSAPPVVRLPAYVTEARAEANALYGVDVFP